jgi:monovalent cation/hydrogen antiporter
MQALEHILALFIAAVALATLARRVGAPYPVFLALGGVGLALVPGAPIPSLPPELVLALFVAPILVDAGYDASIRDLRDNWAPLLSLVVVAVGLTTAAVAVVVHTLVPGMPWGAAIALGAIVAPPDAVAATAVLRPLRPPARILGILEGESLLNDASALLIYRLAVGAVAAGGFAIHDVAPAFLLAVLGSLVAGPAMGFVVERVLERVHLGLSAVLTTVAFAMTLGRMAPARVPARIRIPTNAVWATVIFALNIFAFIFIGLQIRPILVDLAPAAREQYLLVGAAVLATVIVVRLAWHMTYNGVVRWRHHRFGFHPPRPMLRPTVGSGLVISWAGMRGIVTLAAALALPVSFPSRDLIVLTAFLVVLGTLLIQGLTLKMLLKALKLEDGDPVASEERAARQKLLDAVYAQLPPDRSAVIDLVRKEMKIWLGRLQHSEGVHAAFGAEYDAQYRGALRVAREALLAMRGSGEIGDDAFHALENELDWMEASDPLRAANADAVG